MGLLDWWRRRNERLAEQVPEPALLEPHGDLPPAATDAAANDGAVPTERHPAPNAE